MKRYRDAEVFFFLKGEVDESEMSAGFFLRAAEVCI